MVDSAIPRYSFAFLVRTKTSFDSIQKFCLKIDSRKSLPSIKSH